MSLNKSSTAILIFSRTVSDEVCVKNFSPIHNDIMNRKIAGMFIRRAIQISKKTQLPVFTSFSSHQKGNTFGKRLANSIQCIFDKGFRNVITIGNDCPSLSYQLLLKVNKILENKSIVLGPNNNGGLYLLGMNRNSFFKSEFEKMSWGKKSLQSDWKTFFQDYRIDIQFLEKLDDVNDVNTLLNVLKYASPINLFFKKLTQIISMYTHEIVCNLKIPYSQFYSPFSQLRAPPKC